MKGPEHMTTEHFSFWSTDEYGDQMVSCSCGWGTAHGLPTAEVAADSWGDHMYDAGYCEAARAMGGGIVVALAAGEWDHHYAKATGDDEAPPPFTTDHLLDHLRTEAQLIMDRGLVTRGQRLVIRDLLLRAAEWIEDKRR